MSRIAEPKVVVSDGGTGFRKALKRKWPMTGLTTTPFISIFLANAPKF